MRYVFVLMQQKVGIKTINLNSLSKTSATTSLLTVVRSISVRGVVQYYIGTRYVKILRRLDWAFTFLLQTLGKITFVVGT